MLESFDPEIHQLISEDRSLIDLRPLRNYLSTAVLEALGSQLADHYVEGFPGHRLTRGGTTADEVERLGNDRLKALLGTECASIQPSSHAMATVAVMEGLLQDGDTVLAPMPGQGGPLTLGHQASLWAKRFRFVRYGPLPETEAFDPDSLSLLARRASPSLIAVSLMPYPRRQDLAFWREIADRENAVLWLDLCAVASPIGEADVITGATGGLLRGPPGGFIACKALQEEQVLKGLYPKMQAGTSVNVLAAKAVALREASSDAFNAYLERCRLNASSLSRALINRGLDLWTGGTDYHFMALRTRPLGFTGLEAERRLEEEGIAARRVAIAFGEGCSNQGDGLLLGTQAVTLKGMNESEMDEVAEKIYRVLK